MLASASILLFNFYVLSDADLMNNRIFAEGISTAVLLVMMLGSGTGTGNNNAHIGTAVPVVRRAEHWDTSPRLDEIASTAARETAASVISEVDTFHLDLSAPVSLTRSVDGARQADFEKDVQLKTIANFEGIENVDLVVPPDPNGDIGRDYYVQIVNKSFAIFDRKGNKALGPLDNNLLWSGFGGPCEITNRGDPIVLYDHLAERWLLSQFAYYLIETGDYYQCIAVSTTADPMGTWHRYSFLISKTKLNDYPKFGVWPDGYYMAVNQFEIFEYEFPKPAGQGAVVFERDKMLAGLPAAMVYFDMYSSNPDLIGLLPADLDGPPPPPGAPNPYMRFVDGNPDRLEIWEFQVDWQNAGNSTFTFKQSIPTASFDSSMCSGLRNCIPQPGGSYLDAISDRLMYRLQYRNFLNFQTLVTNHTVDTNGFDHAGVRWYELRNNGDGWVIHQQGSYAPDAENRWMGSAAMNSFGDIALGYSVSSSVTYPSIRFTGRVFSDPLGSMSQGEGEIIAGSGYQQDVRGRWGDYSSMSVDPIDACTFWYTQEYYELIGTAPWQTRIASFKLSECKPLEQYYPFVSK